MTKKKSTTTLSSHHHGSKKTSKNAKKKKASTNKNNEAWMKSYSLLVAYKTKHGHCYLSKPPSDRDLFLYGASDVNRDGEIWTEELKKLARWTSAQRACGKKGKIDPSRKKLLDDIEFLWNSFDVTFFENFRQLKDLMKENGHKSVDIPFKTKNVNDENRAYWDRFQGWAREMRLQYVLKSKGYHSRINQLRIDKLNSVGFVFLPEDPEERSQLEDLAEKANTRWVFRKVSTTWHEQTQFFAALKRAKEQHETTGEPAVAHIGTGECARVICKEDDGTFYTKYVWDIVEGKDNVVVFGTPSS